MERELWKVVYTALKKVARRFDQKYVQLQPWRIAAVLLWAALHDRPVSWACDKRNWRTTRREARTAPLPGHHEPTGPEDLLRPVPQRPGRPNSRATGQPAWALVVDGKPLPVGTVQQGPRRQVRRRSARGTSCTRSGAAGCLPEAWEVTAAREYEGAVAERLLTQVRGKGFLLGDGNYEASRVYDAAADSRVPVAGPARHRRTMAGATGTRASTGCWR